MNESKKTLRAIGKLPDGRHDYTIYGGGFCDLCAGEFEDGEVITVDKDPKFKLDIVAHKKCFKRRIK